MTHLIYNSRRWLLSRERNGKIELVDFKTAELLIVDEAERSKFTDLQHISKLILPKMTLFADRPRNFLTDLRLRREAFLKEMRAKKTKSRKVEKSSKGDSVNLSTPNRRKSTKTSKAFEASLQGLPADIQALMKAAK